LSVGAVAPAPARSRVPSGLLAAAAIVTAVMALPLAYLAIRAGQASEGSWDLILRGRTLWLALRSVGLATAVTAATVVIGVPFAWLVVRTDLPLRRLWGVLGAMPLVFPSYVGAFALLAALGPRGMLQGLLEGPFGVERIPDITGFPGAFVALTLFTYPYAYLLTAAALRDLDPALEDAARTLGQSRWRTFLRVTLPLLRPSIAGGALLVGLYTLHDFGAVSLMRYQAFTQAIYLQYRAAFDRTPAAILSLMLVVLALGVLVVEHRSRGRARYHRTGSGTKPPLKPVALGRWRWAALAVVAAVVLAALVLPLSVVVYWLVRGLSAGTTAGPTFGAAGNTVLAAGIGAVLAVVAGIPVATLAARHRGALATIAEKIAYSGYALPGIVVGLAFVFFAAGLVPMLYQSLALLALAYVVLFLPQASEPLRAALLSVSPRIEEAGRVLGKRRLTIVRRLVLPLIRRGAMAGFALVFLTAMKELPATLLLRPIEFETLSTRVWTAASVGRYGRAAVPAVLLVLLSAVPTYILARRLEVQRVRPS
jgi:iron(III) transport system permease protein